MAVKNFHETCAITAEARKAAEDAGRYVVDADSEDEAPNVLMRQDQTGSGDADTSWSTGTEESQEDDGTSILGEMLQQSCINETYYGVTYFAEFGLNDLARGSLRRRNTVLGRVSQLQLSYYAAHPDEARKMREDKTSRQLNMVDT